MAELLTGTRLLEAVVRDCGLSALFAENAMRRALARAGVNPVTMTAADLRRALPEIRKAIAPFLEATVGESMARLERLAR